MERRRLLILASSRRQGGRCIAGVDIDSGGWVRPVGAGDHPELSLSLWPEVGEIWDVPLLNPAPTPCQPENHLVAEETWYRAEAPSRGFARGWLESLDRSQNELFGSTTQSIAAEACRARPRLSSLTIVSPQTLEWVAEAGYYGKLKARVRFGLGSDVYSLPLTDPRFETRVTGLGEGEHPAESIPGTAVGATYLTISLGEPWQGRCYKLVAAVIPT